MAEFNQLLAGIQRSSAGSPLNESEKKLTIEDDAPGRIMRSGRVSSQANHVSGAAVTESGRLPFSLIPTYD